MDATFRSHVGCVRKLNEDAVLCEKCLFAIADGMGGHNAGEVASEIAVTTLRGQCVRRARLNTLEDAFLTANAAVKRHAEQNEGCTGMGTTLTALWMGDKHAYIAHVGDSRAYRLRGDGFAQITQDHSIVAELMRKGVLTPEEARVHPYRNVITRALGTSDAVEIDTLQLERRKGDIYLICSDGLTGMVPDGQISALLQSLPLDEAADALMNQAIEAGGRDNISFVLVEDDGRAC